MTANNLLSSRPIFLKGSDTIFKAASLLLTNKISALPVVDNTGRYLGIFSMNRLLSLLLPRAALLEGGVSDLAFVSDPMETLCERMREHGERHVSTVMETDARVVYPDTPLLEVVLLLYRGENDIPVVDKQSGQLLGMVSGADLLALVCKGS